MAIYKDFKFKTYNNQIVDLSDFDEYANIDSNELVFFTIDEETQEKIAKIKNMEKPLQKGDSLYFTKGVLIERDRYKDKFKKVSKSDDAKFIVVSASRIKRLFKKSRATVYKNTQGEYTLNSNLTSIIYYKTIDCYSTTFDCVKEYDFLIKNIDKVVLDEQVINESSAPVLTMSDIETIENLFESPDETNHKLALNIIAKSDFMKIIIPLKLLCTLYKRKISHVLKNNSIKNMLNIINTTSMKNKQLDELQAEILSHIVKRDFLENLKKLPGPDSDMEIYKKIKIHINNGNFSR